MLLPPITQSTPGMWLQGADWLSLIVGAAPTPIKPSGKWQLTLSPIEHGGWQWQCLGLGLGLGLGLVLRLRLRLRLRLVMVRVRVSGKG